jgi:long-chain acyl-CoA synthetase
MEGVRNVLEFARSVQRRNGLGRLSYVSTAYVAGCRKGNVSEDDLSDQYGFSNNYEQSKFEGESLIREAGRELPVSVFRPGMVVGDSKTGAVKTFNTFYFPLRLYLTGKLKYFPVSPDMKVNLVPCDLVSEAIAGLTFDPQAAGRTFHLTLPAEALPTVREMIQFTRQWAAETLFVRLPSPFFLPVPIRRLQWLGRFLNQKSPIRLKNS